MDERRRFIYTKKEIQKNETIFFQELKTQLASVGINYLHTEAMSDGTLNLTYYGMQIGRVKFSRTGHSIQILTKDDVRWETHKTIVDIISEIPNLVRYAKELSNYHKVPSRDEVINRVESRHKQVKKS